ncbi:MAG: anthranilate phosphoribosyltransferase [Verrucomicrobiota bacterium]
MKKAQQFFEILIQEQGSDLHLLEGHAPKIRKHGSIMAIRAEPLTHKEIIAFMKSLATEQTWDRFVMHGDVDFGYELSADARFRCNYYQHLRGLGAVFRLIPNRIKTFTELGLPDVVQNFGDYKSGLVLVTGPTGSGKSTTLAAIIDYINATYSKHIVTIEEPIEFIHTNKKGMVTQREVPYDVPTFALGLRTALRQDTDVVLVGEMRDLETIALALTAAEMGLLVFGTLHTNHANKTIDRIIDVFPSEKQSQIRMMLAHSLRAVCSQLLLQNKDGQGRFPVHEILIANTAVASIIREGASERLYDVIKTGSVHGMQLMDDAIHRSLKEEKVGIREAYMKSIEKKRFVSYLNPKMMKLEDSARACRARQDLTSESIPNLVDALLDASVEDAYKAEFLIALTQKGETAEELAAFVRALLPRAIRVPGVMGEWEGRPIVDCCGTGGGGVNMVNVSTGMMFILAAMGVPVVKHGNSGVTKKSGSADVLQALGVPMDISPNRIGWYLDKYQWAFIFAPSFHPSFQTISPVRKMLAASGQRTIFNLLGPLLNPVRPQAQLMGVFHKGHLQLFHQALKALSSRHHLIVYGENSQKQSIGEVSADGSTEVIGLLDGQDCKTTLHYSSEENFDAVSVASAEESAKKLMQVFQGESKGLLRKMLILNSAMAFLVGSAVGTFEDGEDMATEAIDSGKALKKLQSLQQIK